MSASMAEGVLAATHKLVLQAMTGRWQDVPKTVAERRVLLDQVTANATPQDQQWLSALRQAMAESDAAVASMTNARPVPSERPVRATPDTIAHSTDGAIELVDRMMTMIGSSR
jgi:hypothetical protein